MINPKLWTCSGKDALTRQREETAKLASFSQVESQQHWTHNSYTKLAMLQHIINHTKPWLNDKLM